MVLLSERRNERPREMCPQWLSTAGKLPVAVLWLVASAVVVMLVVIQSSESPAGRDARVYWDAVQAVRHSGDPYAPGLAAQAKFHAENYSNSDSRPFSYVYGPVTVPLLRLLGNCPPWLLAALFGIALAVGIGLTLRAGWQMARDEERGWLRFLLPFANLFPGLLVHNVLLSGNVVYGLYGPVLIGGVRGVRRGRWGWFYAAVLAAGILKPPLLTLLAFAVVAGRRQWLPAGFVGATGLLVYAAQARLWPQFFAEYLLAVRLQFDWNHDFGCGPAGVLGAALYDAHLPFAAASTALYVVFASGLLATMLALQRWCVRNNVPWQDWIPLVWMGTLLLNPRLKEYDVAAITVPMLLASWRLMRSVVRLGREAEMDERWGNRPDPALLLAGSGWFVAFNVISIVLGWKETTLGVLLGLFSLAACWLRFAPTQQQEPTLATAPEFGFAMDGPSAP